MFGLFTHFLFTWYAQYHLHCLSTDILWIYVVACLWYLPVLYTFPWVHDAWCTMITESVRIYTIMILDKTFSIMRSFFWLGHASCSMCFHKCRIGRDTKTDRYIALSLMQPTTAANDMSQLSALYGPESYGTPMFHFPLMPDRRFSKCHFSRWPVCLGFGVGSVKRSGRKRQIDRVVLRWMLSSFQLSLVLPLPLDNRI